MSRATLEGLLATYRVDPEFIAEGLAIEVLEQAIAIMRQSDVSKAELARRLDVSRSAVTHLFKQGGHNLTMLTMARLATALGTELRVGLGEPVQLGHMTAATTSAVPGNKRGPTTW